jgi:aromatic ring hydroxylase-like protein
MHNGRPLLIDPAGKLAKTARPWAGRVDIRKGDRAMLIRPDGYVAWAGEDTDKGLKDALRRWFG